jgi:hypothetical protein
MAGAPDTAGFTQNPGFTHTTGFTGASSGRQPRDAAAASDNGLAQAPGSDPQASGGVAQAPADGDAPAAGVAQAPGDSGDGPRSAGLFTETVSPTPSPTIAITNLSPVAAELVLTGSNGEEYSLITESGEHNSLTIPAGDYSARLISADPSVGGNYGDASFHRFRQYDATWVLDTVNPYVFGGNLHLGDD